MIRVNKEGVSSSSLLFISLLAAIKDADDKGLRSTANTAMQRDKQHTVERRGIQGVGVWAMRQQQGGGQGGGGLQCCKRINRMEHIVVFRVNANVFFNSFVS